MPCQLTLWKRWILQYQLTHLPKILIITTYNGGWDYDLNPLILYAQQERFAAIVEANVENVTYVRTIIDFLIADALALDGLYIYSLRKGEERRKVLFNACSPTLVR